MTTPKKSQTLSIVLATKNEEKNLASCLDSVVDIADQIVIVDEESTDKTVEIAKKYKALVKITKHEPIFHLTKQKAIDLATSDWILQLDADERLTPSLHKEIKLLLSDQYYGFDRWLSPAKSTLSRYLPSIFTPAKALLQQADAYYLPRKNFFLTKFLSQTGQYPDPVIRLFRRGKAHLPAQDVHEQMVVEGVIGWMTADLEHNASPDFHRYLDRENRYSSLHAVQLSQAGVRVNVPNTIKYLFVLPLLTFIKLFIRYRGFMDGFPGFVFSLYSGFHHAFSYMKLWELKRSKSDTTN
jgi:glycosyltransferase involved in cell wall biosynthesis